MTGKDQDLVFSFVGGGGGVGLGAISAYPSPSSPDPIDLTQEDDALQRALALSIQEMQRVDGVGGGDKGGGGGDKGGGEAGSGGGSGGISLEDQELSRCVCWAW